MCCHIIYQPASQTPLQKYFYVHGFNLVKAYPCREEKKTLPDQDLTTIMNPWLRSTFLVQQHSLIRLVAGIGCWRKKKKKCRKISWWMIICPEMPKRKLSSLFLTFNLCLAGDSAGYVTQPFPQWLSVTLPSVLCKADIRWSLFSFL